MMTIRSRQHLTRHFPVLVITFAALCLAGQASAEDSDSPFVCRTFAFFVTGSDLGPDYFLSDESIAVVAGAVDPADATSSPLHFAPCPEENGELADTTWVRRNVSHITKGNHTENGSYYWLLTDENPEPPPKGVMTLTGEGSPLILSQELILVTEWQVSLECRDGQTGDLAVGSVGSPVIIVTALFNR